MDQKSVAPLQFSAALENLCLQTKDKSGHAVTSSLLEVGQHSALKRPISTRLQAPDLGELNVDYLSCLIRDTDASKSMHHVAGSLFEKQISIDIDAVNFPAGNQRRRDSPISQHTDGTTLPVTGMNHV